MKVSLCFVVLFLFLVPRIDASVVAIIDSGTDMRHQEIAPKAWVNPLEIPQNDRDEDRNGYQDDIHGWNFAEGNSLVIDYTYSNSLTPDVRRFFTIQTDFFEGRATDEDLEWMRDRIQNPEHRNFRKQLQICANFIHGTHVGGIAIKNADRAKLLAVKLIPTEVKLPGQKAIREAQEKGISDFLIKQALRFLAVQQMNVLEEIGAYVHGHKVDVANNSFGTGYTQAKAIVGLLVRKLTRNPTPEKIEKHTKFFLNTLIREGERFVSAAPNTLFVFAAGNEGLNNDEYPASPTNIQAPNTISVAATLRRRVLAPFSSFGQKMVDVGAPGVSIDSSVPGDQYLKMSGTSQAAPYVSNIAARVKGINPGLTPKQIKKILMKTVDLKEWLKDKVSSSGIVNKGRATKAAQLSLTLGLNQAIAEARVTVKDVEESSKWLPEDASLPFKGLVLPLSGQFVMSEAF